MTTATISQIAAALGKTTQAINLRKRATTWQPTGERVQGGGDTYDIDTLQLRAGEVKKIKAFLDRQNCKIIPIHATDKHLPAVISPAENVTTATLANYQRSCMEARLLLLMIIKINAPSMGVKPAIKQLVNQVNVATLPEHILNAVPIANARANSGRTLSLDGVMKWWGPWKKSGFNPLALAPGTLKDSRTGQIVATGRIKQDPPWVKSFMAAWRRPGEAAQKPYLTDVLRKLAKDIPEAQLPTYDQARSYLKSIGQLEANRGRMTGNELRTLMPYRRRLTDHMYPGDCYTADGHCFDAEVAHPFHGRPFRPEITLVLDIATRYVVGWSCDLAESGLAVLDALRMACETVGPPVIFYTDNGPGYKNQLMTAPGTGILGRLHITPEYSRPRNPQAHGISERAHRTILVKAAKELCTYMGASMDTDAKQLAYKETRKAAKQGEVSPIMLEFAEFVAHVNRTIEEYHQRDHRGLPEYRDQATRKRRHLSPAMAMAIGMKQQQADLPPDYQLIPAVELPDLYHPAQKCKVIRGTVTLSRKIYSSPDLKNYGGEEVQVAFSPSDPSKVWVRRFDTGSLITVAKLDGNASPYFAKSYIDEKREDRAIGRQKRILRQAEEIELEARGPAHLTIVPEAAQARENLKMIIQAEQQPIAPAKPVFHLPPTQRGKYKYWCEIEATLGVGGDVLPEELNFHAKFQLTQAWLSEREVEEFARMQACK